MNRDRRRRIASELADLAKFEDAINMAQQNVEAIAEEEREGFDYMPENMKQGEEGSKREYAADLLEQAAQRLQEILDLYDQIKDDLKGASE